ncbi:MAG: hypothetical protein OXQ86_10180 [Gammaproteobacteria bacterium]|nr:hypothetical protein [Gammaproteobacteria bacterium]
MSDKRNRVRSFLAGLVHWLGRVLRRRFSPDAETVGAIGSGEELPRRAETDTETVALPQAPPRQPVGQVLASDGHPPVAVVDLGRDISAALRTSWDDGRPFESGGVIDSVWLQPLFAAGSTAASSLAAGNVFLATANPETLMVIRGGLSSAIIGEGGRIIEHAPFIAASSAILPVVAPVMLFMTVSSLITGARLDRMQRTLGTLSEALARVRQVMEAETYAKFQSATNQLDEIWSQFEHSQRFTDGMKAELVQARRDINRLHNQSGHLTSRKISSVNDAKTAVADINLFFLSSLMDIRADVLRLFLTLQDDPGYSGQRQAALHAKFEQTNRRLKTLLKEGPIKGFHSELQRELAEEPFYDLPRRLQRWFGGGLPKRIREVETIRDDFKPIRERIERWTGASDSATGAAYEQSIVVYRELDGERALRARHTQDLRLQRVGT